MKLRCFLPIFSLSCVLLVGSGIASQAQAQGSYPPRRVYFKGRIKPVAFGKTREQILAMGPEKWMEFQGERAGYSTPDMVDGLAIWNDCVGSVNDEKIAALPDRAQRLRLYRFRELAQAYNAPLADIDQVGGGTIQRLTRMSYLEDIEDALASILQALRKPGKAPKQTPEELITLTELRLEKIDKTIVPTPENAEIFPAITTEEAGYLKEGLGRAVDAFHKAKALAKSAPPEEAAALLTYFAERAKNLKPGSGTE